jgi:beta-lactamase class A
MRLAVAAAVGIALAVPAVAGVASEPALPAGGSHAHWESGHDAALEDELEALGRSFDGWAGFWVHDLRSGRTAGWNSDARFAAASLVKLGILAAALRRFGPYPERSSEWPAIRDLARTSSNRAANRLVDRVGGLAVVADALRRLGMWSSTYPGPYRIGTSSGDAPKPPPHVTWRVTTAHDLGRALYALQAAALGNRRVERRTGLSRHEARLAISLLVHSVARGENVGLLRPSLPGVALAQKNGWITDLRGTAAIVYLPDRPTIVVVLAYRPGLELREAQALGARVARLVTR